MDRQSDFWAKLATKLGKSVAINAFANAQMQTPQPAIGFEDDGTEEIIDAMMNPGQ